MIQYEIVCAVDGAWGLNSNKILQGGIEGNIKRRNQHQGNNLVYIFSGPINVKSSEDAEVETIIHVIGLIFNGAFGNKPVVIRSDSTNQGILMWRPTYWLKMGLINHGWFILTTCERRF